MIIKVTKILTENVISIGGKKYYSSEFKHYLANLYNEVMKYGNKKGDKNNVDYIHINLITNSNNTNIINLSKPIIQALHKAEFINQNKLKNISLCKELNLEKNYEKIEITIIYKEE